MAYYLRPRSTASSRHRLNVGPSLNVFGLGVLWTSCLPIGQTTLLRRWINVNDVDSTSQQRRVPSGCRVAVVVVNHWQGCAVQTTIVSKQIAATYKWGVCVCNNDTLVIIAWATGPYDELCPLRCTGLGRTSRVSDSVKGCITWCTPILWPLQVSLNATNQAWFKTVVRSGRLIHRLRYL